METDARLQQLEDAVRELNVQATLTFQLQMALVRTLSKTSPTALAVLHEELGGVANSATAAGTDVFGPPTKRVIEGLRQARSLIGQML